MVIVWARSHRYEGLILDRRYWVIYRLAWDMMYMRNDIDSCI